MHRAMGISVHTGWGACVVVGGSLAKPEIIASEVIRILDDSERFCFLHMAAEMKRTAAETWIATARRKATANARRALAPFFAKEVHACAIRAEVVPPARLDVSKVGKLAPAPWGRDQKLAALAAWLVMRGS
jgi:hypothetical protein